MCQWLYLISLINTELSEFQSISFFHFVHCQFLIEKKRVTFQHVLKLRFLVYRVFLQTDIQKYCPLQLLYAEKNSKEKNALQTLSILVKKLVLSIFQKLQEKFGSESYPSNNQGLMSAESLKKNSTKNVFRNSSLRRLF